MLLFDKCVSVILIHGTKKKNRNIQHTKDNNIRRYYYVCNFLKMIFSLMRPFHLNHFFISLKLVDVYFCFFIFSKKGMSYPFDCLLYTIF